MLYEFNNCSSERELIGRNTKASVEGNERVVVKSEGLELRVFANHSFKPREKQYDSGIEPLCRKHCVSCLSRAGAKTLAYAKQV